MHWLTIVGILLITSGTFLTYWGQQISNEKSTSMLVRQNEELQSDLNKIKSSNEELKKRIHALKGVITPDNKPTPQNACGTIPPNMLALFFGNSVAFTNTFPHSVIEVGNEKILEINKENENITISAKFFSKDGKIVAELKDNKFYINPNNYFRIERQNDHTLEVYDQEAKQILNIEYINQFTIKLLGIFYLPNRPPIIIEENFQQFGGIKMSKNCFGNNRVDIKIQ